MIEEVITLFSVHVEGYWAGDWFSPNHYDAKNYKQFADPSAEISADIAIINATGVGGDIYINEGYRLPYPVTSKQSKKK